MKTNKSDAVNPAIASRFALVHHWRVVTDPERYVFGYGEGITT